MRRQAFTGGLVLDEDGSSFHIATVHVVDQLIVGVDSAPAHADEEEFDLSGRYLIPGLVDAHYHLISRSEETMNDRSIALSMIEGVVNSEDCIASGVTSVRDCGCRHAGIYELKAAISSNLVIGPEAMTAGRNPTGSQAPRHWRNIVGDGEVGIRRAVRTQVEAGAGWIKIILAHAFDPLDWGSVTEFMTDAEIGAAIDEAHSLGVPIGAHCEGWSVAERGIRLGLDSLDHAPLLSDVAVAGMRDRRMTYTPTLWAFSTDAGIDLAALTSQERERVEGWREQHVSSVQRAYAAGVPIAAGSDSASAVTGRGVLLHEMQALAAAGLPLSAVLRAATCESAAVMGRGGDIGTIASGRRADFVVANADPLRDLEALRSPESVWKGGALRFSQTSGIVHDAIRQLDEAVVARW